MPLNMALFLVEGELKGKWASFISKGEFGSIL